MFYLVASHRSAKLSDGDYAKNAKQVSNSKGAVPVLHKTQQTYMKFNRGILNLDQALSLHLIESSFSLYIELYLSSLKKCMEAIGNTIATNNKSY